MCLYICNYGASQMSQQVKTLPSSTGDSGEVGSIPGSGRSPAGGNGNPSQCSCLKNTVDRGRATARGVAESDITE